MDVSLLCARAHARSFTPPSFALRWGQSLQLCRYTITCSVNAFARYFGGGFSTPWFVNAKTPHQQLIMNMRSMRSARRR